MAEVKMGRPKKEISVEEFEKLCAIQCTEVEIADWFRCSVDTINRFCKEQYEGTFAETYKRLSATGKVSLRRAMFKKATVDGNPTMQIWLSKQMLGMREPQGYDAPTETNEELHSPMTRDEWKKKHEELQKKKAAK